MIIVCGVNSSTTEVDYQELERRLGKQHLARRLRIQAHHVSRLFGCGKVFFHIENIRTLHRIIRGVLRAVGVYGRGRRNALDVQLKSLVIERPDLPPAFHGFQILHISDTHIDGNPGLLERLIDLVEPLRPDLCVFTGDFREGTFEDYIEPAERTARLGQHIHARKLAILGNHDAIEMTPFIEAGGVEVLLNEHVVIQRGSDAIYVAGVDDPHYYETDNLDKALDGIASDSFTVLLAHSPELIRKASFAGVHLYLCGHTHGGQICLPGGRPLLTNSRCPHASRSGFWMYEQMTGFTSPGAGTSSVNVRFNCPPEITLIELRCAASHASSTHPASKRCRPAH